MPGAEQRTPITIWWMEGKYIPIYGLSYGATFISIAVIVGYGGVAANYELE